MKALILIVISLVIFLSFIPLFLKQRGYETNIYVSRDLAQSFERVIIKTGELASASFNVLAIEIDSNDPELIYVGTRGRGLFKRDSAGNWSRLEGGKFLRFANVYDIAIDPRDSQRLYLATYQQRRGRIFRSEDGGESWQETYVVSRPEYAIFTIEVDNSNLGIVYAGTAEGALLKSTDHGRSWSIVKWVDDVISDIAVNPKNTSEIYLSAFESGLYKSEDKGLTWQSLETQLEEFQNAKKIEKILIDPNSPNVVYAASEYGILTSEDHGQTWKEMKLVMVPKPASSLSINKKDSNHLYYGAGAILYQSLNRGQSWKAYEIGGGVIKAIAVNPQVSEVVYIGTEAQKN